MAKLNKTQQLELMETIVNTTINSHTDLFKKDKSSQLIDLLMAELKHHFAPKSGGGTSNKINENGEVYCNYFQEYFPAEDFATKLSKPDKHTGERKEVYKANCKTAEQILRKLKTIKNNVTKQTTDAFRNKLISEDEFNTVMDGLEDAMNTKYQTIDDLPTVADLVGLTEALQTDVKPVRGTK